MTQVTTTLTPADIVITGNALAEFEALKKAIEGFK